MFSEFSLENEVFKLFCPAGIFWVLTVRKFHIIVAAVAVAILLCVVVLLRDFGCCIVLWCGWIWMEFPHNHCSRCRFVVCCCVVARLCQQWWKFRIIVAAVAGLLCVVVLSRDFASSDGNSA